MTLKTKFDIAEYAYMFYEGCIREVQVAQVIVSARLKYDYSEETTITYYLENRTLRDIGVPESKLFKTMDELCENLKDNAKK